MNRRGFLGMMIGGVAAVAAVRTYPFRVFSFPAEILVPEIEPMPLMDDLVDLVGDIPLMFRGPEIDNLVGEMLRANPSLLCLKDGKVLYEAVTMVYVAASKRSHPPSASRCSFGALDSCRSDLPFRDNENSLLNGSEPAPLCR